MHVLLDPLWVQAITFYMQSNMQNAHHTSNTAVFALSRLQGNATAVAHLAFSNSEGGNKKACVGRIESAQPLLSCKRTGRAQRANNRLQSQ